MRRVKIFSGTVLADLLLERERGVPLSWATVFESMDADSSGFLTKDELRSAFAGIGVVMLSGKLDTTFAYYDRNGDGLINLLEFRQMAVDVIAAQVQLERAVRNSEQAIARALPRARERAAYGNANTATFAGESEAEVVRMLESEGARADIFDTAQGVQSFLDLLYRRYKARARARRAYTGHSSRYSYV